MIMTPSHKRWDEFYRRLEGPEGCNFRYPKKPKSKGDVRWDCAGGHDKTLAAALLKKMGFSQADIAGSLEYFDAAGGHCDCEILFNVEEYSAYKRSVKDEALQDH